LLQFCVIGSHFSFVMQSHNEVNNAAAFDEWRQLLGA